MASDLQGLWEALCEEVSAQMEKDRVPGAALGILHEGAMRTAGFGVTNVEHPLEVTDETFFQVGSISKTFAATAVMTLVEEGRVDLDATVRTYIPEFRVADEDVSARVSVRHLLTHMGGWEGDWFRATGQGDDALERYMGIMEGIEQLAPLGSVWSYNNAGFAVIGRILETVTGATYDQVLSERVLKPLGLSECFLDHADVMTRRFATGHSLEEDEVRIAVPWPLPRYAWAAGGILCPVRELLKYASFHLGDGCSQDGTQVLKKESMEAMRSPQVRIWGESEAMGLSWFMRDTPELRQIWHGGGTRGQVCMLHLVPARKFAVALVTNADQGRRMLRDIIQSALLSYLDLDTPRPAPAGAEASDLAPLAGAYRRPYADMELGMIGGRLVCQYLPKGGFPTEDTPVPSAPPPWTLDFCGPDRLILVDGELRDGVMDILRKDDGSVGWLRFGSRIYVRQN